MPGARNAPSRARRQCPPNTTAASAATYPLRCFAPQWARFDNRHSTSAPDPTLAQHQRQRRKRYKRSPEPTTTPAEPIPRSQHRQICTCPPRAKGSLNRRFEWFSLVPFFLQKKKGTRAGARNAPSRARRQCPPNTTAASAATYPLRCSAPQWARFDNRHSISAPAPTLAVVSGSGAGGTSSPPNRQRYPPYQFREISTPILHDP